MKKRIIAFLTDFGVNDAYAGTMKGVILGIAPDVLFVDLTHNISKYDIKQAAFILRNSINYFPRDTIFLSIVDPGVGSDRRLLAIKTNNQYFLAPDNGLMTYVLDNFPTEEFYALENKELMLENVSNTFHGRDIFAPVAAHLANGIDIEEVGHKIKYDELIRYQPLKFFVDDKKRWHGEIVYFDTFGNIITSIDVSRAGLLDLNKEQEKKLIFEISNHRIYGLSKSYSDVKKGELLAYIGSSGYVELAVREGEAAPVLNIYSGDEITVRLD